nr:MAG TPA: nucelotide kinase [Caudoviricetes sp.]
MKDNINHPDHYQNIAGVEAIDILNDVVKDLPGKQAAMLWNSMKYLFRFQKKNGVEDLKKARNYLDYLIEDMEAVCDTAEKLWDTWYSNEYGRVWIFAGSPNPNGMPTKLIFEKKDAAEEFKNVFYNMLSEGYDEFSITDACLEMKFKFTKGNKWNKWDELVPWKKIHDSFTIKPVEGNYALIFNYKNADSKKDETAKPNKTVDGPCVIYDSKISGKAEVHYSMQMYAGTCTTIAFTSELARDLFISSFLNKLGKKRFSIRDVLNDANFVVPSTADTFIVKMPWSDLFAKFRMRSAEGEYLLDFIYKHETFESLIKQPTSDEHISYHSSVWGNADVYYSTDMPQGTCTKILFDDEGGRNTFAIKFFRYLSVAGHRFSIQDILEDARYLYPKENNSLHFTMPWNEIFEGFHMTDEGGKYALEFIIDLQGGK